MKTMILSQYDFISIWLRHLSASFGIFRHLSASFGIFRHLSASFGIFRHLSASFGRILCIGLFLSVSACGGSGGGESGGGGGGESGGDGGGESGGGGGGDTAAPTAPTGLKAVENTASKITLSWDAGSGGNYYEIYRNISASETTSTKINDNLITSADTKFVDTGLTASTKYYYWLKYCKTGGACSGFSSVANATTKLSTVLLRKCPSGEPPCVVTIAGPTEQTDGSAPKGYKDGTAEDARFSFPFGITLGPDGNLYVADATNNRIRKVTALGVVSTFAGNGANDVIDGTGIEASFRFPRGLMFDKTGGNFYTGGSGNKIRKITPKGVVTTLNADLGMTIRGLTGDASGDIYALLKDKTVRRINLKTGEEDAKSAALPNSTNFAGVVIGPEGKYLYATDQHAIYKMELPLTNDKIFIRIAGGTVTGFKDGTGDEARFNSPSRLVFDKVGNLYVADMNNHRIRKLSFDKDGKVTVSTFAGTGETGDRAVKDGAAKTATFLNPIGIAYDKDNHLFYVSESAGNRIRKIVLP